MNKENARKAIINEIRLQKIRGENIAFNNPAFNFLTEIQAEEWLKIGRYKNFHTTGGEEKILIENMLEIFMGNKKPLVIIDLGCGDGLKSARLINYFEKMNKYIARYIAVDVNELFLDVAVENVMQMTKIDERKCVKICTQFECLETLIPNELYDIYKENQILFLFLGNTINNFKHVNILQILKKIMPSNSLLWIGAKCRRNSTKKEIMRMLDEFSSFGPDFTFSFGELLGGERSKLEREVKYNFDLNRIEVWLRFKESNPFMEENELPDYINVGNSYRPTNSELRKLLSDYFKVVSYSNADQTEYIFVCKVTT